MELILAIGMLGAALIMYVLTRYDDEREYARRDLERRVREFVN